MGRKSRLRKARKAAEQHSMRKSIKNKEQQKKRIDNWLQQSCRTHRQNQQTANELGTESVLPIVLTEGFDAVVELIKETNRERFAISELMEVINRVYGSGLMSAAANKHQLPLYDYCASLITSWLNGTPRDAVIPSHRMLRIGIDCNTFEMIPEVGVLSASMVSKLHPEFSSDIRTGANVMMELVINREDALFFAMHMRSTSTESNVFGNQESVYVD